MAVCGSLWLYVQERTSRRANVLFNLPFTEDRFATHVAPMPVIWSHSLQTLKACKSLEVSVQSCYTAIHEIY